MYNRVDSGPGAGGVYRFTGKDMGNSHLQFEACRILIGLLIHYLEHTSRGLRIYRVGSELNMHLDPNDLGRKVTPDCYIMEDEPQAGPKLPSWKPWEHGGKVPSLAVEVVSDAYTKDYAPEEAPQRYQELGVGELVRYDPEYSMHRRCKYPRRLFGHFVRDESGVLREVPCEGEALRLRSYPIWLVHRPPYYLRLAEGPSSDQLTLWATADERARAEAERSKAAEEQARAAEEQARAAAERAAVALERAQAESERAQAESERAQAESERADHAEAELSRLRAELERLRTHR